MKQIKSNIKTAVIAIFILLINVFAVIYYTCLYWKPRFQQSVLFYQDTLEIMYQRQAQNLPAGSIVFLGDSQIQGLAVTAISPNAVNFGIGHQQLQRLAKKINDYPGLAQTEKIVIGIGINDLLHTPDVAPGQAIAQLVKGLSCCRNKVLLLGVLAVNEKTLQRPGLNQRIVEFNRQLQSAAQAAGMSFLDLYPLFTAPRDGMRPAYDLGDGLHLNPTGYEILIQQIKNSLQKDRANEF